MGKIKRSKTSRVHQFAVPKSSVREATPVESASCDTEPKAQTLSIPTIPLESNPFAGLDIKLDSILKQSLQSDLPSRERQLDVDADRKLEKSKTPLRKKVRMKQRKEEFLQKLSASYAAEAKRKKKKSRSQVPVVSDMIQLKEALPNLQRKTPEEKISKDFNRNLIKQELSNDAKPQNKTKSSLSSVKTQISKPRKIKQRKKKRLELLEIQKFQDVLKSGGFKEANIKALNN